MLTMKEYVRKIYVSHVASICKATALDFEIEKSILIIDCYSVHKCFEFREWMKEYHPCVIVIFVLGNCTTKLQPCDVIVQCPFKAKIHR